MSKQVLFSDSRIELIEDDEAYFLRVHKQNMEMTYFNNILSKLPQLKLTEFGTLKHAMEMGCHIPVKIGVKKPKMELRVSQDRMTAFMKLNMGEEAFELADHEAIAKDAIKELERAGVVFGYDYVSVLKALCAEEEVAIAHGQLPQKGDDAILKYYDITEPQPQLNDNGSVNHYELNLIINVDKGDWVGERVEPKDGLVGQTVLGEVLPGMMGRQYPLMYDPKTIEEVAAPEEGKTYLYALKQGALVLENDRLTVCNYLEIDGKVSFKTGNIDFDGAVGVTDTIEDNFSIIADKDIQVLGDMGVGAVDTIESRTGDIYIRGGIAGKNKARVQCSGNLYTKFAADCTIVCDGIVNIGYYAMNCHIKAKEVILESENSKIIGGKIEADIKVVSSSIGNRNDLYTEVVIKGFDRKELESKSATIEDAIDQYQVKLDNIAAKLSSLGSVCTMSDAERNNYNQLMDTQDLLKKNLEILLKNRKNFEHYLSTKGEGEVRVTGHLYGGVKLTFRHAETFCQESNLPITYYLRENKIMSY